jgi:hypothetical protein
MSDERMIRIENLKLLKKQTGWTNEHIGQLMGVSGAYVGKLINKKTAFTEKTARHIEEVAGKPRMWMDAVHSDGKYSEYDKDDLSMGAHALTTGTETPLFAGEPQSHVVMKSVLSATNIPRAPVVEWAALEETVLKQKREWPAEAYRAFTPVVDEVSDYVKIAKVVESPLPSIQPGDMVAVDPKATPWDDCVVVIRLTSGRLVLRRYRQLATGGFEAICPNEPPLDSARHGVTVLGVVVGLNKMRF